MKFKLDILDGMFTQWRLFLLSFVHSWWTKHLLAIMWQPFHPFWANLYASYVFCRGKHSLKRRLRIRTLQFGTARNINELYDSVDPEVVLSVLVLKVFSLSFINDNLTKEKSKQTDFIINPMHGWYHSLNDGEEEI